MYKDELHFKLAELVIDKIDEFQNHYSQNVYSIYDKLNKNKAI